MQLNINKKYGKTEAEIKTLPFDIVVLKDDEYKLIERHKYPTLIGILMLSGSKFGFTSHGNPIYLCNPLDQRYPPFLVGSKLKGKDKMILFKFESWTDKFPRGSFISSLGDCGEKNVELSALLYKYSPYTWSKILPELIHPSFEARYKIMAKTINIDPDGCKDVDDCISIWKEGTTTILAISIADVHSWIELNPWLNFAENIGTSFYKEGVCVKPMFPKIISEDLCSLVIGKERLAISLFIHFDGLEISAEWRETIVEVSKSYTYDNCQEYELYNTLKNCASLLTKKEINDSHDIIETLMIFYNLEAGKILKQDKKGVLRFQKEVDINKSKFFPYEVANYCLSTDSNTYHTMLESDHYTHITSPIRRYADCINQSYLKEIVFHSKNVLNADIYRLNFTQKSAKRFERDIIFIELFYANSKNSIEGIIVSEKEIYIPLFKKIVKFENTLTLMENVLLRYYSNKEGVSWKDRIILELDSGKN